MYDDDLKTENLDLVKNLPTKYEKRSDNLNLIYKLCNRMEFICENLHGIGMNAFQLGVPWQVFIVKTECGLYNYFVDCSYLPTEFSQLEYSIEGCLSLPKRTFQVLRHSDILVEGFMLKSENGFFLEQFSKEFSRKNKDGFGLIPLALVFQHEIDHHFGKLISDFGHEIILHH